jgi:hypothetical protein
VEVSWGYSFFYQEESAWSWRPARLLQYLDAVKRDGVFEMLNECSGVHVEKLEIARVARAETAAK